MPGLAEVAVAAMTDLFRLSERQMARISPHFRVRMANRGLMTDGGPVIAARERLRPILMTSLAFIFGTLPLAVATGAGAGAHVATASGGCQRGDRGHDIRELLRPGVSSSPYCACSASSPRRTRRNRVTALRPWRPCRQGQ